MKDEAGLHDDLDGRGMMLHGCQQDLEMVGQDTKGVLHDSMCAGKTVIKYPLVIVQPPQALLLHDGLFQAEGFIANDKVGHILIVVGQRVGGRESEGTGFYHFLQFTGILDMCIRCCSGGSEVCPDEFILVID